MKKSEIPWAYRDWSYEEMKAKGQFHEANEKATELDRLQAENAKLKMHAEAMHREAHFYVGIGFDITTESARLQEAMDAYRADFPKETNNDK